MSQPRALLALARKLVSLKAKKLDDAPLRRAISTAYYSLFHLLSDAATELFVAADSPYAGVIRRCHDHKPMKDVSEMFARGNRPKLFQGLAAPAISEELKLVARAFVELQLERHTADYDRQGTTPPAKAMELVDLAERAFRAWETVKGSDEARIYVSSFLLYQSTWNKSPRGEPKPPDNPEG